jgi:hypothetical protein
MKETVLTRQNKKLSCKNYHVKMLLFLCFPGSATSIHVHSLLPDSSSCLVYESHSDFDAAIHLCMTLWAFSFRLNHRHTFLT